MKRYCSLIVYTLILLFVFSSCIKESTIISNLPIDESIKLQLCGSYAVPGMFSPDLKGVESIIHIRERDSKGRILLDYTAFNVISGQNETVLLICQKLDEDYVYFYEDICYLFSGYNEEDVHELKTQNDWDQPYNDQKLSRRRIDVSIDLYINNSSSLSYNQIRDIIVSQLKLDQKDIMELCFVDNDVVGNEINYLFVEKDGAREKYLLFVDRSYTISYLKIEGDSINTNDFHEFKLNNHWVFGSKGIRDNAP